MERTDQPVVETAVYGNAVSRTDTRKPREKAKESSTTDRNVAAQPSKELKELGSKARARLEEEKMKRPEIQLLEKGPTADPVKKVSTRKLSAFSAQIASQKPSANMRKRKISRPKNVKPSKRQASGNSWIPIVSHIPLPDPKERSATVKLHGLPIDCTLEHVKKFFTGLQPDGVSVLLANNTTVSLLDASNPPPCSKRGESRRLRVLAHFRSVSAAVLASERSGETMYIKPAGSEKEEEFVIAVTVLPRYLEMALSLVVRKRDLLAFIALRVFQCLKLAVYLLQSIPAVLRIPLAAALEDTSNQLHAMVDKVLWTVAALRTLNDGSLPIDRDIQEAQIVLPDDEEEPLWRRQCHGSKSTWRSHPIYQRFAKHYNRLVDIQDELLHQTPYPAIQILPNDNAKSDPIVHLTTEACKALSTELDAIESLLYRARVTYRLQVNQT